LKKYEEISVAISKKCCAIANLGTTWEECWEGLVAGKVAFVRGNSIIPRWPDGPPMSVILKFPGQHGQPSFSQRTDILARIIGEQMRHSMNDFIAAHPDAKISLIVATSHGNPGPLSELVDIIHSQGITLKIQTSTWLGIVVDNLVKEVNIGLGRQLPGITISAACASSLVAISHATDRINAGMCDAVLVVGIDTLSRVASVGFNNIGAMSKQGCRPYDKKRDGTTVGEGAVALFLSKENLLSPPDVWGLVRGSSVFCDAAHMVEPNPVGIAKTIYGALQQGSITADHVHGIFWHGTGTRQNDKTEAEASKIIFGNNSPLCTSTKGSLGHTMGASGGFNVLAACETIHRELMPHVAVTDDVEYDNLNLALHRPCPVASGPMLVTALGFGGINAAVLISPPG